MKWVLVERMQFSCKTLTHYLTVRKVGNNLVKRDEHSAPLLLLFQLNMAEGPCKYVGQNGRPISFLYLTKRTHNLLKAYKIQIFHLQLSSHLCLSSFDFTTSILAIFSTPSWVMNYLCGRLNINAGVCVFPAV